ALSLKDTDIMREKNSLIDRFCIRAKPNIDDLAAMDKPEIRDCLNILASWYRDAYLLKAGLDHSEVINFDRKNELLSLVENSDFAELDEALNAITGSVLYLEKNINVKLMLHNLGAQLWRG
ncbi:MAG: hypothetical protein KJ818_01165, partial [Candidatus Omnitrophica bacterium]|nr:hypothetical protein [Candidatus Omnitrophota bacterium]